METSIKGGMMEREGKTAGVGVDRGVEKIR